MPATPDHAPDHANIKFPPPLLYAAGLGLGLGLDKILPVLTLPRVPSRIAALLGLLGWVALSVTSMGLFRRARTSLIPIRPATALVVSGPYRFTRNPMYLGLVCLYLAVALWFNIFWALVLLPLVIAAVHFTVIAREESYLERKFGADYLAYKARVRRWI